MFSSKRKADDDASPDKVWMMLMGMPLPPAHCFGAARPLALGRRTIAGGWYRQGGRAASKCTAPAAGGSAPSAAAKTPAHPRRCVPVQAAKMANGGPDVHKATFTRSLEALNSQFAR